MPTSDARSYGTRSATDRSCSQPATLREWPWHFLAWAPSAGPALLRSQPPLPLSLPPLGHWSCPMRTLIAVLRRTQPQRQLASAHPPDCSVSMYLACRPRLPAMASLSSFRGRGKSGSARENPCLFENLTPSCRNTRPTVVASVVARGRTAGACSALRVGSDATGASGASPSAKPASELDLWRVSMPERRLPVFRNANPFNAGISSDAGGSEACRA